MSHFTAKCVFLLTAFLFLGLHENRAEDFRIENRVFVEGKKEPVSQSVTLFHDGMVYDLMLEPAEVTVFDKASSRFVMLNMVNCEQTELPTAEVSAFADKLKRLSGKQKDSLSRFFADPKFEERFDASSRELSMTSPSVKYQIVGETLNNPAILAQYRDFSDWYSRLNAMLKPGSRPPMARLLVNDALARHEVIAREVNLTMTSVKNDTLEKTVLHSEHVFAMNLTPSDIEQIQKVRKARDKFKVLSYDKYAKKQSVGR